MNAIDVVGVLLLLAMLAAVVLIVRHSYLLNRRRGASVGSSVLKAALTLCVWPIAPIWWLYNGDSMPPKPAAPPRAPAQLPGGGPARITSADVAARKQAESDRAARDAAGRFREYLASLQPAAVDPSRKYYVEWTAAGFKGQRHAVVAFPVVTATDGGRHALMMADDRRLIAVWLPADGSNVVDLGVLKDPPAFLTIDEASRRWSHATPPERDGQPWRSTS